MKGSSSRSCGVPASAAGLRQREGLNEGQLQQELRRPGAKVADSNGKPQ